MLLTDYRRKDDWDDRWNPILVRQLRQTWKGLREAVCYGYPLSALLAVGLMVCYPQYHPAEWWDLEIPPWMYYGLFVVISYAGSLTVAGMIEQELPTEEYESLVLTALPRQEIMAGYVQAGFLMTIVHSGLALPFIVVGCCQQKVSASHALLIVSAAWLAGWAHCVIMAGLSLQSRVKCRWRDHLAGLHPILLIPFSVMVPLILMFLILPFDLAPPAEEDIRKIFDRETDPLWKPLLVLLPWGLVLLLACRFITRWTVNLLNRCVAK